MYTNAVIFELTTAGTHLRTVAIPQERSTKPLRLGYSGFGHAQRWVTRYLAELGYQPFWLSGRWEDASTSTCWADFERRTDAPADAGEQALTSRMIHVRLVHHSHGPRPDVLVTRSEALALVLLERGIIDSTTAIVPHARGADIQGKHVIGILPHQHQTSRAATVTEIPLRMTPQERALMKRADLPVERMRKIASAPMTYVVRRLSSVPLPAAALEAALRACSIGEAPEIEYADGRLICREHSGQFLSVADLRTGLVKHSGPHESTPWLDPKLSTGEWIEGRWVNETDCAIMGE